MKITIICIGKLKESYWRDAAGEYRKRLQRFGAVEIIECPDQAEPKGGSAAALEKLVEGECAAIAGHIRPRDYVIALCIDGKQPASDAFAQKLATLELAGTSRVVFLIGGSNGLSKTICKRADERISFSAMTFPHQLARVMLLEQLYRARKILAHESYHK